MVYTVTFNPALDYIIRLNDLKIGAVNRADEEEINVGGKGINVSTVLNSLEVENVAVCFVAGFTGLELEKRLKEMGINSKVINVREGMSRINVKLMEKEETEINGVGPIIGEEEIAQLFGIVDSLVDNDILVLAGSIPPSVPQSIYSDIVARLSDKNVKVTVDATGKLLLDTLEYRPFLVKPNIFELGKLFDAKINTEEEVIEYGKRLQEMGAGNVLVSMGAEGAILIDEYGKLRKMKAPAGEVVNTVGSGDSMVAGFIAGYLKHKGYDYALKLSVAAGSASAFSMKLATKEEIYRFMFGNVLNIDK